MNGLTDAMRIAIVAPPWYPLPPRGYGGTELVVHLLHTELRRMGPEAIGVSTFSPSEATSRHLRDVMRNFVKRNPTERTQARRFHAALEFTSELGPRDAP